MLATGTYDLKASCTGYIDSISYGITVYESQTITADFALELQETKDETRDEAYVRNPVFDASLSQRFPVELRLARGGHVLVRVIGPSGKVIKTLLDGEGQQGVQVVYWDGTTEDGIATASGVYMVHIQAAGMKKVKKIVLLR